MFDIQFNPQDSHIFTTLGADGSMRLFDCRYRGSSFLKLELAHWRPAPFSMNLQARRLSWDCPGTWPMSTLLLRLSWTVLVSFSLTHGTFLSLILDSLGSRYPPCAILMVTEDALTASAGLLNRANTSSLVVTIRMYDSLLLCHHL